MPRNILHLKFEPGRQQSPLGIAKQFAADHREALLNASRLLGGPKAERRCQRLFQDLRDAATLARRLRAELVDLHRLLTLDKVDDIDTEECARFAEIHPADPRVHEVCLLADRLHDLLRAIVALDSEDPDVGAYLAASAA